MKTVSQKPERDYRFVVVGAIDILLAFAVDQLTKAYAVSRPELSNGLEVFPFFNLVLVRNHGVSFGILSGAVPWWGLTCLGLIIVLVLGVLLWRAKTHLVGVALGLVIGGALGNLLDRLRHKAVTDFLDFHLGIHHWPAFNLADVAIVIGAGLLVLDSLRVTKPALTA